MAAVVEPRRRPKFIGERLRMAAANRFAGWINKESGSSTFARFATAETRRMKWTRSMNRRNDYSVIAITVKCSLTERNARSADEKPIGKSVFALFMLSRSGVCRRLPERGCIAAVFLRDLYSWELQLIDGWANKWGNENCVVSAGTKIQLDCDGVCKRFAEEVQLL